MVNQTEFVDHLKERMNEAIEKDFYFRANDCINDDNVQNKECREN